MASKIKFPGQKEGEKVFFILRKSWLIHFLALLRFAIFLVLPACAAVWAILEFINNFQTARFYFLVAFLLVAAVFILESLLISWVNDEMDLIIFTNLRVIDVTEVSLFARTSAEAPIQHIQDIKGSVCGFWGTILHFGTIKIVTANQYSNLKISMIFDPVNTARKIFEAVSKKEFEEVAAQEREKSGILFPKVRAKLDNFFGKNSN